MCSRLKLKPASTQCPYMHTHTRIHICTQSHTYTHLHTEAHTLNYTPVVILVSDIPYLHFCVIEMTHMYVRF